MKKLYLILLSVFALLNTAMAQELKVKSFVLAPTDITAQTEGRKDLNGDACALVKISFVGDVADVEGNVIKPLVKRDNETWAFMTQESRQMKVITKDYLPLMVTFGDYGIEKLQGNRTYVLTLAKPSGASETQQMQTLTIKYSPITASVLVDNKFIKGTNGVAKTSLPIGQHSFVVACDGYESEEGTVKLKSSAPSNLQITLSKENVEHMQQDASFDKKVNFPQDNSKTFDVVEEMPSFPGGIGAMMSFISSNVKYPSLNGTVYAQGRVVVSFVVERDGTLSNVEVQRSVEEHLDREAVRVVKSMPKWNPGKQKGKAVRVKFTIAIAFRQE